MPRIRPVVRIANGGAWLARVRAHRGNEPVSPLWDRFDVSLGRGLSERLPQHRDAAGEIRLFNEGAGPDVFQQPILVDQVAGVFDEHPKEVEHPGRERNRLAVAKQLVFRQIQRELPELACRL
jgi:hypothetical protein